MFTVSEEFVWFKRNDFYSKVKGRPGQQKKYKDNDEARKLATTLDKAEMPK